MPVSIYSSLAATASSNQASGETAQACPTHGGGAGLGWINCRSWADFDLAQIACRVANYIRFGGSDTQDPSKGSWLARVVTGSRFYLANLTSDDGASNGHPTYRPQGIGVQD